MAQRFRQAWSGIGYCAREAREGTDFVAWLGGQFSARSALALLVSFLVSQTALPGGSTPCCVPLVAALLLLEKPALPAVLGCALGLLARWQPIGLVNGWPLAACVLLTCTVRGGWDWKPWKVSLAAAACMALPLPLVMRQMNVLLAFLTGSLAAGLLTPVFTRALLAVNLKDQTLSSDDRLCLLLTAAALSLGMRWVDVRGCTLGDAAAALCVWAAGWCAGPGLAVPSGVLLGLAQTLAGGEAACIVYLAVCGAISGLLRGGARWLCAAGTLAGCAALVFLQGGEAAALRYFPPLAAAALVFALAPRTWLDALRGLLLPRAVLVSDGAGAAAVYLLRERALALEEMTRLLPDESKEAGLPPVELLACRLCTGCERQHTCWDARREEALRLLDYALSVCGPDGTEGEADVLRAAQTFACQRDDEIYSLASALAGEQASVERERTGRSQARAWVTEQLDAQARALSLLCEGMEAEDSTALRARSAICAAMPALRGRPEALTVSVMEGRLHVWLDVRCESESRLKKLEDALSAATGVRMELLRRGEGDLLLFSERPALRLAVGRAGMPAAGENVSGDGAAQERLDAARFVMALSDGMGCGGAAHRESRAALELLLRALRAGYHRRDALRAVNGMMLACRGEERFATMDLCVADLDSGEVLFEKLGACPSYLLRGGRCRRIGGDALPLGIVSLAQPRQLSARLLPGDLLLMVTDGVVDAFGRDDAAFVRALGGLAPREGEIAPQRLAELLLKRALERCQGVAPDDMTVLAARVEEA